MKETILFIIQTGKSFTFYKIKFQSHAYHFAKNNIRLSCHFIISILNSTRRSINIHKKKKKKILIFKTVQPILTLLTSTKTPMILTRPLTSAATSIQYTNDARTRTVKRSLSTRERIISSQKKRIIRKRTKNGKSARVCERERE